MPYEKELYDYFFPELLVKVHILSHLKPMYLFDSDVQWRGKTVNMELAIGFSVRLIET